MAKDLTTSAIDRQYILNNPMALPKIKEMLDVRFLDFKGTLYVTKQMAEVSKMQVHGRRVLHWHRM